MKDKHIHIQSDSDLLKTIYRQVETTVLLTHQKFTLILWSKFIGYALLTVGSYTGLYFIQHPFLFIICYVLFGFAALLLAFNFAHDLSHNTVFRSKKWNNLGFICIYTLNGAHAEAWKQRHIHSHHYAPNVEEYDSDLKISSLIRVIPGSPHYWYHSFQHIYAPLAYTTYSLFWVFIKDFVLLFSKDNYQTAKGFTYHLSFWFQKLCYLSYLVALPLLFSVQPWIIVLSGFLLMHLCQSLFLLFTFFMTHHVEGVEYPTTDENGYINTSWLMNQIKSSNDMHPFSPFANFVFGGFNNHIAHHLFPHIHHIYYPQLSKVLYAILNSHHIAPNHTTYTGGIISHIRLLKHMSKKQHQIPEPFPAGQVSF